MHRLWLPLVALALGCGGEQEGGGAGGSDSSGASNGTTLPSPYADSGGDTERELPTLDAEQAAAASIAGLQTFVGAQPDQLIAAYQQIAGDGAEEGCPEQFETFEQDGATTTVWRAAEGCTTSGGVEFRGSARLSVQAAVEGDVTIDAATLSSEGGVLHVAGPDGSFFEMAGYVATSVAASPTVTEAGFELSGEFSADAVTAAGSPLLDGTLQAQGFIFSYFNGGSKAIGGSGSLSGSALQGAQAVSFSGLLVAPDGCAAEPVGTVSVRDEVGYWHDIVFDAGTFDLEGDQDVVFDAAACDGCGAYLAGGEPLGEACVSAADVQSLVAWEESPW